MCRGKNKEEVTYADWNLGVPPSFKNTLAILEKTGYPLSIEELDINKISLTYYEEENTSDTGRSFLIRNREEIKAIQNALILEQNCTTQVVIRKVVSNVIVTVYTEKGETVNSMVSKERRCARFRTG